MPILAGNATVGLPSESFLASLLKTGYSVAILLLSSGAGRRGERFDFFAVSTSEAEGTSWGTPRYASTCSATRLNTGPHFPAMVRADR